MENKRSLIIINRPFQLKFSLFISSLVFVSSLIYPGIIYSIMEKSLPPQKFNENIWLILGILTTLQVVFSAIVFIIALFQSHKIAGPLYKLNKTLLEVASGHKLGPISFRNKDNFLELAESYNKAVAQIISSHHQDFAKLSEISTYIKNLGMVVPEDKKIIISKIVVDLDEIQKKFD